MRAIVTPNQIYPVLQATLGLPDHCISFELRAAAGQYGVTVTCEHYVALDAPGLKQLESVLSEFDLVRWKPAIDPSSAQALGFDTWMRQRTEHAHAEFMKRTKALPHSGRNYARGGFVTGLCLVGEPVWKARSLDQSGNCAASRQVDL